MPRYCRIEEIPDQTQPDVADDRPLDPKYVIVMIDGKKEKSAEDDSGSTLRLMQMVTTVMRNVADVLDKIVNRF
jgi:hypothetical protein